MEPKEIIKLIKDELISKLKLEFDTELIGGECGHSEKVIYLKLDDEILCKETIE